MADSALAVERGPDVSLGKLQTGASGHHVATIAGEPCEVGYAHLRGALGYPGMKWGIVISAPLTDIDAKAADVAGHTSSAADNPSLVPLRPVNNLSVNNN